MFTDNPKSPNYVGERYPKLLYEITGDKQRKRFAKRVCQACRKPILKHFILNFSDPEMRGKWWCRGDATQWSPGMAEK